MQAVGATFRLYYKQFISPAYAIVCPSKSFHFCTIKQNKKQIAMRGKFITTNLKLAVLAGGKKSRLIDVKETSATLENFKPIWSKDIGNTGKGVKEAVANETLEGVF